MGELQDPVAYDGVWWFLAAAGLALVALYYAIVQWLTRPRRFPSADQHDTDYLGRLAEIERDLDSGDLSARVGHQQVSRVVRELVAVSTGVPATTMTLSDLQVEGPERLSEVVELLYPPAFGDDEQLADQRLPEVLDRARDLVTTWT